MKKLSKIYNQSRDEVNVLQIGKKGISTELLNELEDQLKKTKFIKVRILKNAPFKDRADCFAIIRQRLKNIEVMDIRGRTAIIKKK
ncbi:MAG: YhbY family RNA-binding protein [Candidatus Hodarchaeales archaeon]